MTTRATPAVRDSDEGDSDARASDEGVSWSDLVVVLAAWVLSFAAMQLAARPAMHGVSRTALALAPWLAIAGLPRPAEARTRSFVALLLAASFAPVALGVRLDAAAEVPAAAVCAASALVLVALLAGAAASARGAARVFVSALWFALVVAAPAVRFVFGWGSAGVPAGIAHVAELSPFPWLARMATRVPSATELELPWAAFALAVALFGLSLASRKDG